jgi:hypothetical protein
MKCVASRNKDKRVVRIIVLIHHKRSVCNWLRCYIGCCPKSCGGVFTRNSVPEGAIVADQVEQALLAAALVGGLAEERESE